MIDIKCCDCLDGIKLLPDNSVDMVLTSPPYDSLRKYTGYTFKFEKLAWELLRVIKTGGVVIWVVGDSTVKGSESGTSFKQALFFKEIGFNIHDTMIYRKINYMPLNHNRYEQEFEYMFCFSLGKPKTFNPIKIPCVWAGTETWGNRSYYKTDDGELTQVGKKTVNDTKIKGNIFEYRTGSTKTGNIKHPAMFPYELAVDMVSSWSNEGDLVLDPLIGSGTTAVACQNLRRNCIGYDISPEYCEVARSRLW